MYNNIRMKSTITTPDELTTLRIEGSSGTYKIFSSFRPMESPAFVDAVDRKYNLAEIKNLSGGKGYFLVHLNKKQQETIQEDLNAVSYTHLVSMPDVPALPANDYYHFTCYFRFE